MEWNKLAPHLRHLSRKDQERVRQAHELGVTAHHGQKRKSGEPYFTHPNAVAIMLADMGADPDTLIAALLHDTIEDTDLRLDDIDARFGGSVRALIDGVTKLEAEDVAGKPTLDEQTETLRKMFTLMEEDVRIMVIKLVDRLHNMQTIAPLSEERKNLLARETQDIYVKIAERLSMHDLRDELERLCLRVLEPKLLEDLEKLRASNERRGHNVIQSMKLALHKAMQVDMRYEVKTWEKLMEQLHAEHASVTGLSDITVVFFARDEDECYRILGLLHQIWQRETLSFQDFINSPAINGYKGLHTTVILEDGTRVRCKIRTKDMHEYARKGIASRCFDRRAGGVTEYLPWTERIQALSKDTADRSKRFWQSLQSDILGESIVVHGANDLAVSLPEGSTALDGVFYCFQDKALRTESIKVDGREVPFSAPLTHGASLNITLATRSTVQREWLQWVRTGIAAARIREALSMQSEKKRYTAGKEILQKMMLEKQKGYIEEFNRKKLQKKLSAIGFDSIEEAYKAIADGRLSTEEVFGTLFTDPKGARALSSRGSMYRLRFTIAESDIATAAGGLAAVCAKFSPHIKSLKVMQDEATGDVHLNMYLLLKEEQKLIIQKELGGIGIRDMEWVSAFHRQAALLAGVIFLWALNPVMAKWFLMQGIEPLTLITIRLLAFGTFSVLLFGAWLLLTKEKYSRVSRISLYALPPALGLIGMTIFNYLALADNVPSVHLTILRLNVLLLPIIVYVRQRRLAGASTVLQTCLLLIAIVATLLFVPSAPPRTAIALSLLALISYTSYSMLSEHVLSENKINARYPLFLFYLGIPLGVTGLLLLPFQTSSSLNGPFTLLIITYVFFCVFVPHLGYASLLRKTKFRFLTNAFLLEVPLAALFETVLLGIAFSLHLYLALSVILLLLLLHRWLSINWWTR